MKKIISVIVSLLMLSSNINTSYAEEFSIAEYDAPSVDTLGPIETPDKLHTIIEITESEIEFDETVEGTLSEDCKKVEYSFELEESGTVFVDFSSEGILGVYLNLYDENMEEVWDSNPWWDSTSEHIAFNENIELTAGTYSFYVSEYSGYGNYELELSFESANETFQEEQNGSNNTLKTADEIVVDEEYTGHLAQNDKTDIYTFYLEESGGINLSFVADGILGIYLNIYDKKGQKVWDSNPWWDSTSEHIAHEEYLALTSGTYFLHVSEYSGLGSYDFELLFTSAEEYFEEEQNGSNNTFKDANEIECDSYYIGQIANNDKIDIYSFSINNTKNISLSFTSYNMYGAYLDIYNDRGKEIWSDNPWWDSTTEEISFQEEIELQDGEYYLSISEYSGVGEYEFIINTDSSSEEIDTVDDTDTEDFEDNDTTSFDSKVSEWAKDEVEEAYENDLIPETIIGTDLTEYITRAEFAAIAVQLYEELSGIYAEADYSPFIDIDWNENLDYINKAYTLGITSGTSDTTFDPDIDITREQLATMLCRTIKKYSFDDWTLETDSDYYLDTSGVKKFADDNEISDYAKPSVYYMAKFDIIKGVDDTHFAPRNVTPWQESVGYATATREQAILMSLRIFNVSDKW